MTKRPKILCICDGQAGDHELPSHLQDSCEIVPVSDPLRALAKLNRGEFSGLYVTPEHFDDTIRLGRLLRNERILDGMADGVLLLDADNTIIWANHRFCQWTEKEQLDGENFYAVLDGPEILGPDFCPFHSALATCSPSTSTLRTQDNRYFQLHVAPVFEASGSVTQNLIVTIADVTDEVLQQQQLDAIHKAGIELADLSPEEVFDMTVDDRIELLKSNILHYTKDLLRFDVIEIRMIDEQTGKLEPLLSVGIDSDAARRPLFARPQNNGVTGFVAATGKSYLCEDTTEDPLYIEGFIGARSSLTVPLIMHDQVIGTFNVESPEPGAFSESDLQFLEIFSRDTAHALNTLELLVAQKATRRRKVWKRFTARSRCPSTRYSTTRSV